MRDKHTAVRREVIQSLLYVLTSSSHYAYDSDVEIDLTATNRSTHCSQSPGRRGLLKCTHCQSTVAFNLRADLGRHITHCPVAKAIIGQELDARHLTRCGVERVTACIAMPNSCSTQSVT